MKTQPQHQGFTLIEVLVSAGILFIVGSATVGLTNSIIQGTNQTSSETVANRLASEGIELVTKKRDDTVKAAVGDGPWFVPAELNANYGWYVLNSPTYLAQISATVVDAEPLLKAVVDSRSLPPAVRQQVGNQDYYRLICVESVGAIRTTAESTTSCNTNASGGSVDDGNRESPSLVACAPNDYYCNMTKASLARNRAAAKVIPPGNAVKIRSVVIWQDKDQYRSAEISTLLTNWKSYVDAI